eukprot:05010.XXX_178767_178907_1 [CDS] Oithona nana genome sequencing.
MGSYITLDINHALFCLGKVYFHLVNKLSSKIANHLSCLSMSKKMHD